MEPNIQKNDSHWKLCVFLLSSLLCFLLISNIACVHMWYKNQQAQKTSYMVEDAESTTSSEENADPDDDFVVYKEIPADSRQVKLNKIFVNNSTPTEYIRLEQDISSFTVHTNRSICLDLNGHKIINRQEDQDAITIEPSGSLLLQGNGTIENYEGMSLLFNEGECFLSGNIDMVNNTGAYSIINHGYMALGGNLSVSCTSKGSSLLQNGYYDITSGDNRTGYVNGWEYPTMDVFSGSYSGGRISLKNSGAGICRVFGGTFYDADVAALKNWGSMDIYGGDFYSPDDCIVLGRRLADGDHCLGDLRIHGGNFYGNTDGGYNAIFGISAGTDEDVIRTHGNVEIQGGNFLEFEHLYSNFVSPRAVLNISPSVHFTPVFQDILRAKYSH